MLLRVGNIRYGRGVRQRQSRGETVLDNGGKLIAERDYVWLDTLLIAQSERTFNKNGSLATDVFVYIHADQLETPRLATDSSGDVVWRWDSDAFGIGDADLDPDSDNDDISIRHRFLGQYYDDETSLHYNYFRDYDPVTGRYMESDPIGLAGGINTYLYVGAAPTIGRDILGLYTLAEAYRDLRRQRIATNTSRSYSDNDLFQQWLDVELADQGWLEELPACPETLPCADDTWQEPSDSWKVQVYHPGGVWEVRSRRTPGGHSSQCIYDELKRLIKDAIPAAGTANFRACDNVLACAAHTLHDVRPWELAKRLGREEHYYQARPPR